MTHFGNKCFLDTIFFFHFQFSNMISACSPSKSPLSFCVIMGDVHLCMFVSSCRGHMVSTITVFVPVGHAVHARTHAHIQTHVK